MKRILGCLGLLLVLSGCAAGMVLMKNDKGDLVRCEPSTGATLAFGYLGSKHSVNSCVEEYEKVGYRKAQ
jgi:hypothetical protein